MSLPRLARYVRSCQWLSACSQQHRGLHTSASQCQPRRGSRVISDQEFQRQAAELDKLDQQETVHKTPLSPELAEFRELSAEELLKGAEVKNAPLSEPQFVSDMVEEKEKYQVVKDKRSQKLHSFRPKVDPRATTVFLFPGQGSQFVGMGKDLLDYPNVETMYAVASDILGYDLLDVCLNGPAEKLEQTIYQQPAVVVTSLAAVEKLKHTNPSAIASCISAAGFSVGEYSALIFAGVLSFEDGVRVVQARAQAMQDASQTTPSGLMTVFLQASAQLGLALTTAQRYCSHELHLPNPVCRVANFLYPQVKVIGGNMEALEFLEKCGRDFGIRRTRLLPVSGAFHTPLMHAAQAPLQTALASIPLRPPIVPVHANVTGKKYGSVKSMRKLLVEQVVKPVKWEQTMHVLYSRSPGEAFPHTLELGPGRQLGNLLKMVNKPAHDSYESVSV